MSVPVQKLNREQRIWYAKFVIGAILADEEITPSEIDFLKQVISVVDSPDEKKKLMQQISMKKRPPLTPPDGIPKDILAAIYIELVLIMISDLDFAQKEKAFLKEVADLFNFSGFYAQELIEWGEKGLQWKKAQAYLISEDGEIDDFRIPLDKLTPEQRKWYAQLLISTIMLDGLVEDTELQFLKAAMSLVSSKKDQQQLIGYVRNKMAPPITDPPDIPDEILVKIFCEVILIVSADESLSYKEQGHLTHIANVCGFSPAFQEKALSWCNQGIAWKQSKNTLISNIRLGEKGKQTEMHGPVMPFPGNDSVLYREFQCFACESPRTFKGFQLKPHSQEPNRNIFGISTYLESLGDHDFIDFNQIKVIVCPNCFFASTEKNLFKKSKKDSPPPALNSQKFKEQWKKGLAKRQQLYQPIVDELDGIERSLSTIIKTYEAGIKSALLLAKTSGDQSYDWQAVTLKLTMAEILMNHGEQEKADKCIEDASAITDDLFRNATSNLIAIRSARLLFYIGLYKNDIRMAGPFVDYIRNLYLNNSDSLQPQDLNVLKKIYGETQKSLKNRSDYSKESLTGYHLDI